ncbi:MAG: (2Fe-2S)-binding protein [Mycobacteriales bacterium]
MRLTLVLRSRPTEGAVRVYACVCHAVTEGQVRACAERVSGARAANHADRLRHVVSATRAGSGCGTCVSRLRGLCAPAPSPSTELAGVATSAA